MIIPPCQHLPDPLPISLCHNFFKEPPTQYTKGPSTKDVRQMGRGGGFEILDIPGRGEGGGL